MRVTESFSRSTLATDQIKKLIDAAARRGFQAISFTGGEPLLDLPRLVELIRYAGDAGLRYTRTGTNGFMFKNPQKSDFYDRVSRMVEMLADTPLRNFWISLDSSVDDIHEEMRGFPEVVAGIAKALPIFHQAGIYPAVNLGINRNVGGVSTRYFRRVEAATSDAYLDTFYHRYRRAFERFYQKVIDLGFTMANTCYPMSIDIPENSQGLSAVYAATTADDIVRFTPDEKRMLFKALITTIKRFRSKIRIFSPLSSLEALVRQYSSDMLGGETFGCRGGVDFFFVNAADGHVYPCGYRGNEDFGRLEALDLQQLRPSAESEACRQCDWECFRDPSEMFGPLLEIFSNPLSTMRRIVMKPKQFGTWAVDLRYYRACNFFDGRRPPNYKKLSQFASTTKEGVYPDKDRKNYALDHRFANQKLFVS
ncbi:radical SAM domain protein [Desulfosarcina variabilis str. Montpellier]